ncbi:MAG: DUF885 domain-containing protein [Bacterioplanes sp.]|nr:DUF885 domain-containing protein [Bacterioplanes sp.]
MFYWLRSLPLFFLLLLIAACSTLNPATHEGSLIVATTAEERKAAAERVTQLFDDYYQLRLEHSPTLRSRLGYRGQFEWDDVSEEAQAQRITEFQQLRNLLLGINEQALTFEQRTQYSILLSHIEHDLLLAKFDQHAYGISQLHGWHISVIDTLINHHPVRDIQDVHDYIARLRAIPTLFTQWQTHLVNAQQAGFTPPAFVFPAALSSIDAILTGEPFDGSDASPLWDDIQSKIHQLNLYSNSANLLLNQARRALQQQVKPAYQQLRSTLVTLSENAPSEQRMSDLENGHEYYSLLLNGYTSTAWDANTIHEIGLTEVHRIQREIRQLMPRLGYPGNSNTDALNELFAWQEAQADRFPETHDGELAFLGYQRLLVGNMAERLPYFFTTLPQTPIAVKAVEPYRRDSSPIAFYQRPSLDGNRPGMYYVNPKRMNDLPRYRLAALAYHEAVPGHHLQIAMAQENTALPEFRHLLYYPAFAEGWALYAEHLAIAMGGYDSDESLYGKLVLELWRATRLVIDTGLHSKSWRTEDAIAYRTQNTPFSVEDSQAAIQRYLVLPGQATSYKIGELRIQAIRNQVKAKLGRQYDDAKFHSTLLQQGAMPLDTLQSVMLHWADQQRQQYPSQ